MNKNFRDIITAGVIVCVCAAGSYAGSGKAGTAACVFLRDGQGARALGMGGAFAGVGEGVESIFWNPGGIGYDKKAGVSASYNTLIEDIKTQSIGFTYPLAVNGMKMAIGVSGLMLNMDDIEGRDVNGNKTGESEVGSSAYSIAYGIVLNNAVGIGVNLKSVREKLGSETGDALVGDIGLLVKQGDISIGASVQNIGGKFKIADVEDSISDVVRVGIAYKPSEIFEGRLKGLTAAVDMEKSRDMDAKVRVGGEYLFSRVFSVRAGYEQMKDLGSAAGYALGLGYWTDFAKEEERESLKSENSKSREDSEGRFTLEVDYAYLMRDLFDNLHRITLSFKF